MLGSDRGTAFVQGVVKVLANRFSMHQVIGSAYNPQAQSAVERPHREYTALCRTFLDALKPREKTQWDLLVPIFQWTVRTTVKVFNSNYTPYEIVTGMKPRSPLDTLVTGSTVESIGQNAYVDRLVDYVRLLHETISDEHRRIREDEALARYRNIGPGYSLEIGQHVFVKKPPVPGVSSRLQNKNFDRVFVVVERHGHEDQARTYTLSDLNGRRHDLGFTQPVLAERLTSVELMPMTVPDEAGPTRISIERAGQHREATIESQTADGLVNLRFDDDVLASQHTTVDLTREKNQRFPDI